MQLLSRCFECGILVIMAVGNLELIPEYMRKEGLLLVRVWVFDE